MPKTTLQNQSQLKADRKGDRYLELASRTVGRDPKLRAAYAEFRAAVQRVNQLNRQYSTKDADGRYPSLTKEEIGTLKSTCADAATLCQNLMKRCVAKGVRTDSAFYRALEKTGTLLVKDLVTMEHLEAGRTLPEMVEAAHSQVIHIDQLDQRYHKGANSSDRFALEIRMSDGKTLKKGMFTAEKSMAPRKVYDQLIQQFTDAGKTGTVEALQGLVHCFAHEGQEAAGMKALFGLFRRFLRANPKTQQWELTSDGRETSQFRRWYEKYFTPERRAQTSELMDAINKTVRKEDLLTYYNRMPSGSRVDQRNSAMSAVADLLKRPNLLAKAVPVTVEIGQRRVSGTFMTFAEGYDTRPPQADSPLLNLKPEDLKSCELIRDLADLQVIDYLCGNVDRHGGNMLYKMDNGRLTGIQGIDNDSSFGVLTSDDLHKNAVGANQNHQYFTTALSQMRFVNKSMADTVQEITPEVLTAVLQHYELSKEEIDAACERLGALKAALQTGHTRQSFNLDTYTEAQLKDKIENSPDFIDHLHKGPRGRNQTMQNAFYQAFNELTVVARKAKNHTLEFGGETAFGAATADTEQRNFDPAAYAKNLEKQIRTLESDDLKAFRGTQEYQNIVDYAKIARAEFARMAEKPAAALSAEDNKLTFTLLNNLSRLSTAYLSRKFSDGSVDKSTTAARRTDAVRDLQVKAENNARRMYGDEESYRLLSALNREGAFDHRRDSQAIAREIRNMKNHPGELTAAQAGLASIFDGVSRKAYVNMLRDYSLELKRYAEGLSPDTDAKRKPDMPRPDAKLWADVTRTAENIAQMAVTLAGTKGQAGELTGNDALARMKDQLRTLQQAAAEQLQSPAMNAAPDARTLISLHGLNRLAEKAAGDAMAPVSCREQIAEKLLLQSHQADGTPLPAEMDHFREIWEQQMETPAFQMLTEARGAKALKELAAAPPKQVLAAYRREQRTYEKYRPVEAPAPAEPFVPDL